MAQIVVSAASVIAIVVQLVVHVRWQNKMESQDGMQQ